MFFINAPKKKRKAKSKKRSGSKNRMRLKNGRFSSRKVKNTMARKKKSYHKKRVKHRAKASHRRRKSNAKRRTRIVVRVKNRYRTKKRRTVKRRRSNPRYVPSSDKLFGYVMNGFKIIGGIAAPRLIEPMLPIPATSPMGLIAKKVAAHLIPGAAASLARNFIPGIISRKTVGLIWVGIGINAAINLLSLAGYSIPGVSAGNMPAALPAPFEPNPMGLGNTFQNLPERLRNVYMQ